MSQIATPMPTIGVIAERLNEPWHRIQYVIRSRRIKPTGVAGNARVFSEADIAYIAAEIRRINEGRESATE
jgi:hypothetical protein